MTKQVNKVCCFGNTASGKSYLAGKLAEIYDLPQFSLDKIYWQENWQHLSLLDFLKKQKELLRQEKWVLDGTFAECGLSERFAAADLVVLLDSRPLTCLKRAMSRRGKEKSRLPEGADDTRLGFVRSLKFLIEILTFNMRDRHEIVRLAKEFPDKFVLLDGWSAEDSFLEKIRSTQG